MQPQSAGARAAPILRSCEVKGAGAGCVHRRVYPVAALAVEWHAHKWFWGCINPAG